MSQDVLNPEWEDQEVINYIIQYLNKEDRKRLSRQDIQDVLDLIVDYYEAKGYMHDDDENDEEEVVEEAEIDEDEMFNFVHDRIAATPALKHVDDALLQQILDGEYQYGVTIGIYGSDDDEPEYGTYEE